MAKKFTIVYDSENGITFPDSKLKRFSEQNPYELLQTTWHIGNDDMLTPWRLWVAKQIITPDDIEIKWKQYPDMIIEINEYGALRNWPIGFCQVALDLTGDLLEIQSQRAKERRVDKSK